MADIVLECAYLLCIFPWYGVDMIVEICLSKNNQHPFSIYLILCRNILSALSNVDFLFVISEKNPDLWLLAVIIDYCHGHLGAVYACIQQLNKPTLVQMMVCLLFSTKCLPGPMLGNCYRQVSNIRHTKSQNLNDSRSVLRLRLPNPLKPDVKSRMKM